MSNKEKPEKGKKGIESKYNPNVLRQMIEEDKTSEEIMSVLGIVSKQSLRQHVMRLCNEDQKFYQVKGLYVRNASKPHVNSKGDVKISKKMLAFPDSTYYPGDQFDISVDNEKIILTRLF